MRRIIFTTTPAASIVIVQGAYETFCAPANTTTIYDGQQRFGVMLTSYEPPAVAATQEDWIRFQGLVVAWRQERGATSSITESATCPAYQSIIGMGEIAVPFIMATLQSEGDEPDQWFWALKAITGVDPVRDEDRGCYGAMAGSWLRWGKRAGYAR